LAFAAGGAALDVAGVVGGTELSEPDGCDVVLADVTPVVCPDDVQACGGSAAVEPVLLIELRAVVVGGVDELVCDTEGDWRVLDAEEVASPPVPVAIVGVSTFYKDEQVGVDGKDGVACTLCGEMPVVGSAAVPAGSSVVGVVRFVSEIQTDDGGVVEVTSGECYPVVDPGGLRIAAGEPEAAAFSAVAGFGAVVVKDDFEVESAGVGDDFVEDLEGVESLQAGVDGSRAVVVADAGWDLRGLHHLVGEGQADGVVALALDGLQDGFVVLRGEAAGDGACGFEAVPVDACDANLLIVEVEDLAAAGVPVAVALGQGRYGYRKGGEGEEESSPKAHVRRGGAHEDAPIGGYFQVVLR